MYKIINIIINTFFINLTLKTKVFFNNGNALKSFLYNVEIFETPCPMFRIPNFDLLHMLCIKLMTDADIKMLEYAMHSGKMGVNYLAIWQKKYCNLENLGICCARNL